MGHIMRHRLARRPSCVRQASSGAYDEKMTGGNDGPATRGKRATFGTAVA